MKRIILIIAIVVQGIAASSQVKLQKNETDEFTGTVTKTTTTVKDNKLRYFGANFDGAFGLYFASLSELGCAGSKGNYVMFLFNDGTTLKLTRDLADIKCKTGSYSVYMLDDEALTELYGKQVKKVRFAQSEHYEDVIISDQTIFKQIIEIIE